MGSQESIALDFQDILTKCPKSIELLKSWTADAMQKFQEILLEQIKEDEKGLDPILLEGLEPPELPAIDNQTILDQIKFTLETPGSLRSLYEFFDFNGVFVSTSFQGVQGSWRWFIFNDKMELGANSEDSSYINRAQTEAAAFKEAFAILEGSL